MTNSNRRSDADSDSESAPAAAENGKPANGGEDNEDAAANGEAAAGNGHATPTAAQLRRFIKSRPYVPMHELRRRFELNGELDDVTAVCIADGSTVYVGLPARESELLGGLARDGDIGLELSHDPRVPIVVGVFPMRPISRN
jgi:hypothetical protein